MGTAFCKAVTRVKEPCALRLGYKELGTFDGWVAATKNQCGEQEFSDLIKEPERKQEKKSLHIGKGLEFIQCAKERLLA